MKHYGFERRPEGKLGESMLYSDRNIVISGNTAKLTDERIDGLFREYGASDPKYAQAYISSIHPRDFLRLTIRDEVLDKWNEAVQSGTDTIE